MKLSLALVSVAVLFAPQALASCYNYKSKVPLTNYWVTKEGTVDMDNNGNIVHLTGPRNTKLSSSGGLIEMVSKTTFEKCKMEGTCLLKSGKLVNLDQGSTFEVLNRKKSPYGLGDSDRALVPYVSIAVNDLPMGTKVLVKELINIKLPNGKTHNGCVRVDDVSWSFNDCHIDYFVLQYDSYVKMNTPDYSHAKPANCQILNYITPSILDWALLGPGGAAIQAPPTTTKKSTKKGKTTKTKAAKATPKATPKSTPKGQSCTSNDDCPGVTCCSIHGNVCTNDNSAGSICM